MSNKKNFLSVEGHSEIFYAWTLNFKMEEDLKPLMRRVYVQYTNRVGPRVDLTRQEIALLQDVDWFGLLDIPRVRYHVRKPVNFEHTPRDEPTIAFDIVRTHADHPLQNVPTELGSMKLAGVTWKRSSEATVGGSYHVHKDTITPVTNAEAHLADRDTKSQTLVFARHVSGIKPFPVTDFKHAGMLHVVMQLPDLRAWLWPNCKPVEPVLPMVREFKPCAECDAQVLKLFTEDSELGKIFSQIRAQSTLENLVEKFDVEITKLPSDQAERLTKATEIELTRRELSDLADEWNAHLRTLKAPGKQYRALLLCRDQVCAQFQDVDWELDTHLREFTRKVDLALNSPRFQKHWSPVTVVDVEDGELANSLVKALHVVNAQRAEPLKIRWPLPHDVFKTWVALQKEYGPSDDFANPENFGLKLDDDQARIREFVWQHPQHFDRISELADFYPVAKHECQRLGLAMPFLVNFKAGRESMDTVRKSAPLRALVDDILKATQAPEVDPFANV